MGSPSVSVLILSRQRVERLRACLASVRWQDHPPAEIVVLANGCEETARHVRENEPDVRLIAEPENLGCAPGRNRIAAAATGEYLLFLDDDGELGADDALGRLVAALDADPRLGVAKMALYDAVSDEPTGWRLRASRLEYRCYDTSFGGGAALLRAEAFRAAGGYTEAFRGHGEEFDLTVRLYAAGYAVLHCHDVPFRHHVEKSEGDWQREVAAGYQHLQYTLCRLYPGALATIASWKALATQAWVALRLWGGRGLAGELRASRDWAARGWAARGWAARGRAARGRAARGRAAREPGAAAPVDARSLERLYFAKYYRVTRWESLDRAPRGLLPLRVAWRRLRRKLSGAGKLPLGANSEPNS